MDAIMVDVTDMPGSPVGVDDVFTLIGSQAGERIDVRDLARTRTTISWGGHPAISIPSRRTLPASGRIRPVIRLNSVVLPDPFGPMMLTSSPAWTVRLMSAAADSPPN